MSAERKLRPGLLLLCICGAPVLQTAAGAEAALEVSFKGQRAFMNGSIDFCSERVPALKAELDAARAHAEPQISKAEAIVREQIAATVRRDKPLLDRFIASWSQNAVTLLESLKKQRAETACPTLRDNWLGFEADVIVEDWENYRDRNLLEAQ